MDEAPARWMTYRELSDELGISLRAAEARARRHVRAGKWRHRVDNDPPNAARVLVPPADLEAMRQGAEGVTEPRTQGAPHGIAEGATAGDIVPHINAVLAELKASHEREAGELRRRAEAAEAEAAAQRDRAARAEGEGAAAVRERVRVEAERDAVRAELSDWTAGGPLARAWRAFANRRGRP